MRGHFGRSTRFVLVLALAAAGLVGISAPASGAPSPTISVGDVSLVEGDAGIRTAYLPITLSEPGSATVTVKYALAGGTATAGSSRTAGADFDDKRGAVKTVTFKRNAKGVTPVVKYVAVAVLPDAVVEADESFSLVLSAPSSGWTLGQSVATGTVLDDDAASKSAVLVSIGDVSIHEGDGARRAARFAVTLSAPAAGEVTVAYTVGSGTAHCGPTKAGAPTTPGTDCDDRNGGTKTLRFPARSGGTIVRKSITSFVFPDLAPEGAESYVIQLGTVSGPAVLGHAVATGTIRDDDARPVAVEAIAVGDYHACARLETGGVKCWGNGAGGTLGDEQSTGTGDAPGEMGRDLRSANLGTGRTAVQVATGRYGSCAVLDDATLKCWGIGWHGHLGQGSTDDLGNWPGEMGDNLPPIDLGAGRTAVEVGMGGFFVCARLDNGSVKCWGAGELGATGQGSMEDVGDEPGEMGDQLPAIALGSGRTATALAVGSSHACALLDTGAVKCWGNGSSGALGIGSTTDRGNQPGQMGDNLPSVNLGSGRTATAISAGGSFTCARLDDDTLKCWGFGGSGALGYGDGEARGDAPGEMGDALPVVDVGTGRHVTTVEVGLGHTCARLDDGTGRCWGYNSEGQLGRGDTEPIGDGPGEMGDALLPIEVGTGRSVLAVAAGGFHTCALLDDASVKCWGLGQFGQLGQGDTESLGDEPGEMGNALLPIDLGFV